MYGQHGTQTVALSVSSGATVSAWLLAPVPLGWAVSEELLLGTGDGMGPLHKLT